MIRRKQPPEGLKVVAALWLKRPTEGSKVNRLLKKP
jgi:hypothetical protein